MSRNKLIAVIGAGVLITLGISYAVSMNHESSSGQDVDGAFISQMVPHHESAIEMAEVARTKGEHPEVRQLADAIIKTQGTEIETLNGIHDRLFGGAMDTQEHGDLGMDESMMGMDMDIDSLKTAKPFDREFIDQMILHHQGAVRMARVELQDGEDQETKDLAAAIIEAQTSEIEQMNQWREEWYGAVSPSGGVPSAGEMAPDSMDGMEGMEH